MFGEHDETGWNISTERQQLISSLMILGAFIASFSAGFTSRYFGRKLSLWIACVGVVIATVIMQVTTSIGALYAGRLIIGVANGLLMTHCQLYIQVLKYPAGPLGIKNLRRRTDTLSRKFSPRNIEDLASPCSPTGSHLVSLTDCQSRRPLPNAT